MQALPEDERYRPHECVERLMEDRITACILAAAMYVRDQGVPPVTQMDLVPDYLPTLPIDLFDGDGRLIQMHIVGTRLIFDLANARPSDFELRFDLETHASFHAELELGAVRAR